MDMEIKVNEQAQRFYLANKKWEPVVGHEIKVGSYSFCAIPLSNSINVSEVTTGAKVMSIPMTWEIYVETVTKEDSIKFFHKIGELLERIIEGTNFDSQLEEMRKIAFDRLGKMPPIENIDEEFILADVSDVVN